MKVHFHDRGGKAHTLTCETVNEGENGVYPIGRDEHNNRTELGYIPYDKLDYVAPVAEKED